MEDEFIEIPHDKIMACIKAFTDCTSDTGELIALCFASMEVVFTSFIEHYGQVGKEEIIRLIKVLALRLVDVEQDSQIKVEKNKNVH